MNFIDEIRGKVETRVEEIAETVQDTLIELREKAEGIIDQKVNEGKVDHSTLILAEGAAKVTYGVVRGGFAVAGILGHGVAGFLMRRHNPQATRLAAKIIKSGFDAAEHSIQEGSEIFKRGLHERQKRLL